MKTKKTWTTLALVAVFALTVAAVGVSNNALACDKKAKAESASAAKAGSCAKSAKTASASTCTKSAKTASASTCTKSAKTASASACTKSAKTASASACTKSAKSASASMCGKSAKTAAHCCAGENAVAGYTKAGADRACCNAAKADKLAAELKTIVDEVPHMERYRMVVAGSMECGHCTYDATASCQPLLKTTDGKVYPLLRNGLVKRMHKSDAKSFEVSTNVRLINGVKYLEVKSYKSL
jgi:hypothetical protein